MNSLTQAIELAFHLIFSADPVLANARSSLVISVWSLERFESESTRINVVAGSHSFNCCIWQVW